MIFRIQTRRRRGDDCPAEFVRRPGSPDERQRARVSADSARCCIYSYRPDRCAYRGAAWRTGIIPSERIPCLSDRTRGDGGGGEAAKSFPWKRSDRTAKKKKITVETQLGSRTGDGRSALGSIKTFDGFRSKNYKYNSYGFLSF